MDGNNDITVMFSITRNLYEYAPGIIYNLVETNPEVWRIYLFIEDDEFPYPLDKRVRTVNINNFPKYIKDGPNKDNPWTYMSFVRCYVSQILLEDKILYLDLDVIFFNKIKRLWNTDFEGNYMCGVREAETGIHAKENYINSGVLLLNLRAMRKDHIDLKLCNLLQTTKLKFPDQDAINTICKGKIKFVNHSYNCSRLTDRQSETEMIPLTIVHCISPKPWDPYAGFLHNKFKENTEKALGINN